MGSIGPYEKVPLPAPQIALGLALTEGLTPRRLAAVARATLEAWEAEGWATAGAGLQGRREGEGLAGWAWEAEAWATLGWGAGEAEACSIGSKGNGQTGARWVTGTWIM